MKYRTKIEIVTEARDRIEAIEIAGDYLVGNISSGVAMSYSARPAYQHAVKVISAVTVSAIVMLAVILVPQVRHATGMAQTVTGASAIQPPLKTSNVDRLSAEFKKEWQVRQTAEALNVIRQ